MTDLTPLNRAPATRDTDQHDSDAWETVAGWMWACRTCLDKGWAESEADAQEKRARHDSRPLPWWWPLITHESDRTAPNQTPEAAVADDLDAGSLPEAHLSSWRPAACRRTRR